MVRQAKSNRVTCQFTDAQGAALEQGGFTLELGRVTATKIYSEEESVFWQALFLIRFNLLDLAFPNFP